MDVILSIRIEDQAADQSGNQNDWLYNTDNKAPPLSENVINLENDCLTLDHKDSGYELLLKGKRIPLHNNHCLLTPHHKITITCEKKLDAVDFTALQASALFSPSFIGNFDNIFFSLRDHSVTNINEHLIKEEFPLASLPVLNAEHVRKNYVCYSTSDLPFLEDI